MILPKDPTDGIKGRRILITGAAGFIGFNLATRLHELGAEVLGIDNFDSTYDTSLQRFRAQAFRNIFGYEIYEGDAGSPELLETMIVKEPDTIVHLAGLGGVRASHAEPSRYIDRNIALTGKIVAAAGGRMKAPRILIASSSTVYGDRDWHAPPSNERDRLSPKSVYAGTKLAAEALAQGLAAAYLIGVHAMRFFTVYGPYGRPDMAMHIFARALRLGVPCEVFGDGMQRRAFTHISDAVWSILGMISADKIESDAINVGSSRNYTVHDVIMTMAQILGVDPLVRYVPRNLGEAEITSCDNRESHRLAAASDETNLKDGLTNFLEWHIEHYSIEALKAELEIKPPKADRLART